MIKEVSLACNGTKLTNWSNITIRKSIEQFADEYDFELSTKRINDAGLLESTGIAQDDVVDAEDEVNQDDKIEICIEKELVLTGYCDNIDLAYDANDATLRLGGLSKSGDLVDSSAIYQTGLWADAKLDQIIADICEPFGIGTFSVGDLGENFKNFKVQPGEKCYELISRALSMRQMLAVSQPDGDIAISRVRTAYSGAVIELGPNGNVLRANINRNRRDVHNRYIFKGQTSASDDWNGKSASQLEGVIEDPNVKRYRPLVVLARKQRAAEDLGKRALWERNVRAGRGERYRYTVTDWFDSTGRLYEPNTLVHVKDRLARLDDLMLVSTVEFVLSDELICTVEVVPPGTFNVLDAPTRKGSKVRG